MMAKEKTVEVEVVAVVAVAVGGRKPWLDICRRENLIVAIAVAAAMVIAATAVIPAQMVMVQG